MKTLYDDTPFPGAIARKIYFAARINAPGEVVLGQALLRPPSDNEVLVRLEGCGLCASSLPLWEGREWFQYPLEEGVPGHEAWGVAERVGSGVEEVREGDRVALLAGNALAEFRYVKAAECVRIPDALKDIPFPGEPLGCAMNIFFRSRVGRDQVVAVIGAGFLGALLIQLCKAAGARVIAVSRRASSLAAAVEAGADKVVSSDRDDVAGQVAAFTEGAGCDCVIECTGKEEPLSLAAKLCRIRGRLVIAGYHQDGARTVDMQLWNWKGLDVINAHERDPAVYRKGIESAAQAIIAGSLRPDGLYTHRFPFTEIKKALDVQALAPEGFIKALITFD
ncbi:MAG: L-iditol 2-dehydrogenase [Cytophagaceae bacterium SCN 52-12]|nr:MAG: L-iditol 2-dehydrogenase [Cytophagaceae bacterium SCN 52-12]